MSKTDKPKTGRKPSHRRYVAQRLQCDGAWKDLPIDGRPDCTAKAKAGIPTSDPQAVYRTITVTSKPFHRRPRKQKVKFEDVAADAIPPTRPLQEPETDDDS